MTTTSQEIDQLAQIVDPLLYWDDPVGWVNEFILFPEGQGVALYQGDCLSHIMTELRVSIRGPHGLGKSALMAWIILWFAITRDAQGVDWKVLTLASVWRQLERFLWPEVHKWVRRINWEKLGRKPFTENELLQMSLKLSHGEAFAISSDTPAAIEGAHADYILYIFDESKIIPDPVWDSAEGAFASGAETLWVSASTPGDLSGRFYQIQTHVKGYQDWWVRHVTFEETIAAGRMNVRWAENRKKQWGAHSAAYKNRVLGEFSEQSDAIIPYGWIEAATQRWENLHGEDGSYSGDLSHLSALAADIGRGGDPSTITQKFGDVIDSVIRRDTRDTMQVTGEIVGMLRAKGSTGPAIIDVIGLGAGVVDRLRELKDPPLNVIAFNAAEKTDMTDRSGGYSFADCRSAGWWHLRELLDPNYGSRLALPPDDEDLLIADLTAPHWKILSGGVIRVESKEEIRKRLGRSTDYGDVIVMVCWESSTALGVTWEDLAGLGHVEDYQSRWE